MQTTLSEMEMAAVFAGLKKIDEPHDGYWWCSFHRAYHLMRAGQKMVCEEEEAKREDCVHSGD